MVVSVGTLITNLLFKDLRTSLFGKLLIFYNLSIVVTCCGFTFLHLTHCWITVNLQTICHTATITTFLGFAGIEVFATNILIHSAYIMYRCYHLRSGISKKRSNYLFRRYTGYAAFTLILFFFVIIAYDWRTGNGKYTILASFHCIVMDHSSYNTLAISIFVSVINKILQFTMFSAYLVYLYKFNKNVCAAGVTLQHSQKLLRVATALGNTADFSSFLFILLAIIPEYTHIIFNIVSMLFLIEQVVILGSLRFTKKMSTLCKAYFSRDYN